MHSIAPSIAKCLDLFRFPTDMLDVAILHIPTRRRPLKIRIELNSIRWIENKCTAPVPANLLSPPATAHYFAGCRRGSCGWSSWRRAGRTRSWRFPSGTPFEVGEEVDLAVHCLLIRPATPQQVVDQDLGMNLFPEYTAAERGSPDRTSPCSSLPRPPVAGPGRDCDGLFS